MSARCRSTLPVVSLCCLLLLVLAAAALAGCGASTDATDTGSDADSDGPALFSVVVDGRLGFIDRQGDMVIEPTFEPWPYSYFSEGLAPVSTGPEEQFGYIDTTGAMVIEPRFILADPFSEGLAAVVDDNGLWGFIDKAGAVVIPGRYAEKPGRFADGLCMVFTEDPGGTGEVLSSYIDRNSDEILGPFEWVGEFAEGLAPIGSVQGNVIKWGFMDTSGNIVIEPQFDGAEPFSGGAAAVAVHEDAGPDVGYVVKYGYIDTTGAMIIEPQFEWAGEFSDGLAAVGYADGVWGYIDKTSTLVIPLWLDGRAWAGAYPFSRGLGRFDVMDDNGSVSPVYIDKTGKVVWPKG